MFKADSETRENDFVKSDGTITGTWVQVDPVTNNTEALLETAADAAGALAFIRIEDGTYDRNTNGTFYFVTTGATGASGPETNQLGRLYKFTFNPTTLNAGAASLDMLLSGDAGDPVVNPDNIDINAAGQIMICEDCNGEHRGSFLAGRDAGIWMYDTTTGDTWLVAEIDQTAVSATYRGSAGEWETSGVIDASAAFGAGTWLVVVQAHSINSTEASEIRGSGTDLMLGEGGQLLLLDTSAMQTPKTTNPIWLVDAGAIAPNTPGSIFEIVAFDPTNDLLFAVNPGDSGGAGRGVEVWDFSTVSSPTFVRLLATANVPNSVAVYHGLVAVAETGATHAAAGTIDFFRASDGASVGTVTVGPLPDMVTFTPDGSRVLCANEGEPEYPDPFDLSDLVSDPDGSISIIDFTWDDVGFSFTVAPTETARIDFTSLNGTETAMRAQDIRIYRSASQSLEPEYIAVSPDGTRAWVTLQEANAFAVINLTTNSLIEVRPFGLKDWNQVGGPQLDLSDRDGTTGPNENATINMANWPVHGMYQPDTIVSFSIGGVVYYATANEGDEWIDADAGDQDLEGDVGDITLDAGVFTDGTLTTNAKLGRAHISLLAQDHNPDGTGNSERICVYGGRSFSIWAASDFSQVYDSGDVLERQTALHKPGVHNDDAGEFDKRSDNKGGEPEALAYGQVGSRHYIFVGMERTNVVMVFDVTTPASATFLQLIHVDGDVGPEGMKFISATDSPNGKPLLVLANEVSGNLRIYQINEN